MGLALPALAGELLPERTRRDVARVLSIRHVGIALALAVLAPIVAASLETRVDEAREQGAAALLDADLDPRRQDRRSRPELFADINTDDPRGSWSARSPTSGEDLEGDEARSSTRSPSELDDVVTGAVRSAFRIAFIVTARWRSAAALVLLAGALAPARGLRAGSCCAAPPLAAVAIAATGSPTPIRARTRHDRRSLRPPIASSPAPAASAASSRTSRSRPSTAPPATSARAARSCCWRSSTTSSRTSSRRSTASTRARRSRSAPRCSGSRAGYFFFFFLTHLPRFSLRPFLHFFVAADVG